MLNPLISVVVCTYNREKFIGKCLECLKNQSINFSKFEVLVIDNNSKDSSGFIINDFIKNNSTLPFYYFFEANQGLSFARNKGIKESKGTWITYIDDDAESEPNFLEEIEKAILKYDNAVGFGGKIIPKYSESNEPVWMSKYIYGYVGSIDLGNIERIFEGNMKFPIGCNMTYNKKILSNVNGFNTDLKARSDDKYIYNKIKIISNKVYYIPSMVVYHNIDNERLTFNSFKKLYLKTGNEEKVRLKGEKIRLIEKFIEYIIKLFASIILWINYLFKLQEIKGRYIFFSQYYTLIGFLKKDIFVR